MSIEREDRNIVFQCDFYPDALHTNERNFIDAWEVAREQGWKFDSKTGEHTCPACREIRC